MPNNVIDHILNLGLLFTDRHGNPLAPENDDAITNSATMIVTMKLKPTMINPPVTMMTMLTTNLERMIFPSRE
jgi:hypothetical protein